MRITSSHNPAIQYVRSLERAAVRRKHSAYVAEGVRLVAEAINSEQHAALALYDPESLQRTDDGSSLLPRIASWADASHEVSARVLQSVAQTETPAGIVVVLKLPTIKPLSECADHRFGLVLDRIGDPGNAGTILRTAEAFGAGYVVTLPDSVDLFSPKVVRAGMGAHFRLPLYQHLPWERVVSSLAGVNFVASAVRGGVRLADFRWPSHSALVIGSEAHGLSDDIEASGPAHVHIPMCRGVQSLNAAVAASIVMYAALENRLESVG